jgi:hypothetical protein
VCWHDLLVSVSSATLSENHRSINRLQQKNTSFDRTEAKAKQQEITLHSTSLHLSITYLIAPLHYLTNMKSFKTTSSSSSSSTVIRAATATATVLFLLASSCDAFALAPSSRGTFTAPSSSTSSSVLNMNKKGSSGSASGSAGKKKRVATPSGFAGALKDLRSSKFPYAGEVRPGQQSPQHQVLDETIARPDYADTGIPDRTSKPLLPWIVEVKTAEKVEKMRASGKLARYILDLGGRQVKPGVTTDQIDKVVHDAIIAVRIVT